MTGHPQNYCVKNMTVSPTSLFLMYSSDAIFEKIISHDFINLKLIQRKTCHIQKKKKEKSNLCWHN